MKDLANKGIVAEGKVIKKFRRTTTQGKTSAAYLRYEFATPSGEMLERSIAVAEKIFEEYEEGDSIDVVYVPGKPSVNGAKYMVNLSREALKLPPL